jgi:hexosaminidase
MRIAVLAAVMFLGMTAADAATPRSGLPLLPMPTSVTPGAGSFSVAHARIAAHDAGERAAAQRLRLLVARSRGPDLAFGTSRAIRFLRDSSIGGAEAYRLRITPAGVDIRASHDAGLYYGAETLWQLIASSKSGSIPALTIDDHPAFSWRGVMLDSARHFQPVSYVEQLIDRMAMAKLNTLHWHLSDDQGWRIQIDRYPRLTSIGACRREAGAAGTDPHTGKPVFYCGYYSKKDIRAVVAYAKAHHVTVVPEIDMPGHATAMIAAYPQLASIPNPPNSPSHDWGILPNLLNTKDSTFTFIDHVLDEVMDLFPGPFIHLGGDEAVKDQWKSNPAIHAQIKALGLKDEDALQGWFTARVGAHVAKRGRRLIGWDEILGGKIPPDAVVMSWHGVDGAVAAAKSGHDAVLAASPTLYLDHMQSDSGDEPPGRPEIISWRDVYNFDPAPAVLTPDERRHILGLQANLWTEHARTTEYADRMIWPRAAIVAEIGWSNPAKDWPAFSRRLDEELARWRKLGLRYDKVPLQPPTPLLPRTRTASQMELCSNAIPLRLEDDGPTNGKRLVHWVDIMHPCWIWRAAQLDGVHRLVAQVGRLPFNFAVGDDIKTIKFRPPATPAGELEVRRDGCDGALIAAIPLAPATATTGVAEVGRALSAQSGAHDLCMTFTQTGPDPFWVLDRLTLQ